jgi:hypothetical protein
VRVLTPPEKRGLESKDERVRIEAHRYIVLERAGYNSINAAGLAKRMFPGREDYVDLHEACELLEGGCDEATAVAILT